MMEDATLIGKIEIKLTRIKFSELVYVDFYGHLTHKDVELRNGSSLSIQNFNGNLDIQIKDVKETSVIFGIDRDYKMHVGEVLCIGIPFEPLKVWYKEKNLLNKIAERYKI